MMNTQQASKREGSPCVLAQQEVSVHLCVFVSRFRLARRFPFTLVLEMWPLESGSFVPLASFSRTTNTRTYGISNRRKAPIFTVSWNHCGSPLTHHARTTALSIVSAKNQSVVLQSWLFRSPSMRSNSSSLIIILENLASCPPTTHNPRRLGLFIVDQATLFTG